jgi:hypothetical protein
MWFKNNKKQEGYSMAGKIFMEYCGNLEVRSALETKIEIEF